MRRALSEYRILGIRTTLPFFREVFEDPDFVRGDFDTGFIERRVKKKSPPQDRDAAIVAAAIRLYKERRSARPGAKGGERASAWHLAGLREGVGGG
jgi:acetyl/propionyl-CoA carboxylase alpha subunit